MMYCKTCAAYITFFNRQKCGECTRYFCSKCMDAAVPTCRGIPKLCKRCGQLLSGTFTRVELSRYTVKELRQFLSRRDVDTSSCCEKADLVELVLHTGAPSGLGAGLDELEHSRHLQRLRENTRCESTRGVRTPMETTNMTPPPVRLTRINSFPPAATHVFPTAPFDEGPTNSTPVPPQQMPPPDFTSFSYQDPPPAYDTVMNQPDIHPTVSVFQDTSSAAIALEEVSSLPMESSNDSTAFDFSSNSITEEVSPPQEQPVTDSSFQPSEFETLETPVQDSSQELPRTEFSSSTTTSSTTTSSTTTGSSTITTESFTTESTATESTTAESVSTEPTQTESNGAEWIEPDQIRREEQVPFTEGATSTVNGVGGARVPCQRARLTDIRGLYDIEGMTVRQLKALLVTHYVDYKGCCEKGELVERVHRLWKQHARHVELGVGETSDDDLCKICMDAPIDCILLECGHMVTCTNCGKRMAECPICRTYVSRVVHVFKA